MTKIFAFMLFFFAMFFSCTPQTKNTEKALKTPDLSPSPEVGKLAVGDNTDRLSKTPDLSPSPEVGKLAIGMNTTSLNYYTTSIVFTDAMTTASNMLTTYDDGAWDTGRIAEIKRDENGYPTYLPQLTGDGKRTYVRFLVNNYYEGKYKILFDGEGSLGGNAFLENKNYYINMAGRKSNNWIDITTSVANNPVRNIRILPQKYGDGKSYPIFLEKYLEGLKPFHALRFMDWINTNDSGQVHWKDRVTDKYYTQGGRNGTSFEYAIKLANQLHADAWVCVPHKASDDYIRKMARLWRDNLDPGLKIYIEYSNELWNWMFPQAHYVVNSAPGAVDRYVSEGLASIASKPEMHPEKDAFMMARVFRIWTKEFAGASAGRLVKVAAGQHSWVDNSRRILEYLKNNTEVGVKCDALAVGGYFGFSEEDHKRWLANPDAATPGAICDAVSAGFGSTTAAWTRESAAVARKYGVDYLVYEGGQHMQPFKQGEWPYNANLFRAQLDEKMYLLYRKNFALLTEPEVTCKAFFAYSYIGSRESKFGSWGHLESLSQIGSDYRKTAPKYQALLDCNTKK
jgi:hypothetical protein